MSIFKVIFLRNFRRKFSQQALNRKPYSYLVGFDYKTIDIDPRSEILIDQIYKNYVIKIDSS